MTKKQFDYLKSIDTITSFDEDKHEKALGIEEDGVSKWLSENCSEYIDAFDSPGLDVYVYLFKYKNDCTMVAYNSC